MQREQPVRQQLFGDEEVAEIRAREGATRVAVAGGVERRPLADPLRLLDRHRPRRGERLTVPRVARRQHTVEHVDTARDRLHQVLRLADAHEIAGAIGGQCSGHARGELEHGRLGLAHGHAADGVAVEAQRHRALDRLRPEIVVRPALDDAEERLPAGGGRVGGARARRPAQRQRERALGGLARGRVGQALVERHRDVRAECSLDLHDGLRREKARGAVQRRAKLHAVVAELADLRQAEDLESTGVGEDRARPAHEVVQATEVAHHVGAGAQEQMVGVAENDLGAGAREVLGRERLHGGLRAHRHEDGGLHRAVRGGEPAAARGAVGREELEAAHAISMASP